jgi:hypothetical protein
VLDSVFNSGLLPFPSDSLGRKRYFLRSLVLFLFLGFVSGSGAAAANVQNPPVTSVEPGLQFAIADFDGDLRPDIVSIQAGPSDLTHTDYWLRLRLTTTGWESIRVVTPVGIIRLVARDVNGDNAPDLLLTSSLKQPVTILLNDGHGKFSRADPAAFLGIISNSETDWASAIRLVADAVGAPPQSRSEIRPETLELPRSPSQVDSIAFPISGFRFICFIVSHAGRAPPPAVPNL